MALLLLLLLLLMQLMLLLMLLQNLVLESQSCQLWSWGISRYRNGR